MKPEPSESGPSSDLLSRDLCVRLCRPAATLHQPHLPGDSANYIRAANNGVWSQYVGTDGISVFEFLHRRQAGGTFRQHPWSALSDSGDGAALRHFHSPGSFYIYALTQRWNGTPIRNSNCNCGDQLRHCGVGLWIALFEGVPLLVAVLGAIVLSLSPALLAAGTDMTPHPFFSLAATAAIAAFALYWASRRAVWLALWVVTTAAAFGDPGVRGVAHCRVRPRAPTHLLAAERLRGLYPGVERLLLAAVGLVAALFAFWPAGFLRGGYALSYGTLIFQGAFRQREKRDLLTTIVRPGFRPFYRSGYCMASCSSWACTAPFAIAAMS